MRKVVTGGNACEIARRGVDRDGEVVAQSFIEMYTITVDQPGLSVNRSSPSERRTVLGAIAVFVRPILAYVRRAACSLRGHDLLMEFAPTRLSLRCVACGYNTPGWEIDIAMRPVARHRQTDDLVERDRTRAARTNVATTMIREPVNEFRWPGTVGSRHGDGLASGWSGTGKFEASGIAGSSCRSDERDMRRSVLAGFVPGRRRPYTSVRFTVATADRPARQEVARRHLAGGQHPRAVRRRRSPGPRSVLPRLRQSAA